jgi:hypothetical protein
MFAFTTNSFSDKIYLKTNGDIRMKIATDRLVRQHMAYLKASENSAKELSLYDTIYDHMFYYFNSVLKMSESESMAVVDDFRTDSVLAAALDERE